MGYHQIQLPRVSQVAEQMIFKTLWDRLPKRSFISDIWLRDYAKTPLFNNCFAHVLSVKEYPYFRMYYGNIILCTIGEKALWDQASEEALINYALDIEERSEGRCTARWDNVKELKKDLIVLYKKYFPYTVNGIVNYKFSLDEQRTLVGYLNKKFIGSLK